MDKIIIIGTGLACLFLIGWLAGAVIRTTAECIENYRDKAYICIQ